MAHTPPACCLQGQLSVPALWSLAARGADPGRSRPPPYLSPPFLRAGATWEPLLQPVALWPCRLEPGGGVSAESSVWHCTRGPASAGLGLKQVGTFYGRGEAQSRLFLLGHNGGPDSERRRRSAVFLTTQLLSTFCMPGLCVSVLGAGGGEAIEDRALDGPRATADRPNPALCLQDGAGAVLPQPAGGAALRRGHQPGQRPGRLCPAPR